MSFRAALLLAIAVVLVGRTARADDPARASHDALFRQGSDALHAGAYDEAVASFELLADRGVSHPDLSFDRAMAYIGRATTPQQKEGDLGRAAAALEETLLLRPGDREAASTLEKIREELARRRARRSSTPIAVGSSLGWAVVGLASEDTWAILAGVGSLLTTIGLGVSLWIARREIRIAGLVTLGIGFAVLALFGLLAALAHYQHTRFDPAVVVVGEARLLEDGGGPISGPDSAVPEGALLHVRERRGQRAYVRWNDRDGWIALSQIRFLQQP